MNVKNRFRWIYTVFLYIQAKFRTLKISWPEALLKHTLHRHMCKQLVHNTIMITISTYPLELTPGNHNRNHENTRTPGYI